MKGLGGGERTGWSWVNSLSKLLTSTDSLIDGRKGGFTLLVSRASQSISWRRVHKVNEVSTDNWLPSIRVKSLLIQHNSIRLIPRNQSLTLNSNDRYSLDFYIYMEIHTNTAGVVFIYGSMREGFYLKELISFHLVCIPLSRSESFQRILLQQLQTCL